MSKPRVETIDGVLHYVWRKGDDLPDYQPIGCIGHHGCPVISWNGYCDKVIWPKLLNDRVRHQRMINEAFEKATEFSYEAIEYRLNDARTCESAEKYDKALSHLAIAGAYVKRMMEYVQAQIDKEGKE